MAPNGGKRTGNSRSEVLSLCALALLISREMHSALIQGDTRNPCSLFAYRIDRWWPKFHYACPKFELMITYGNGAL
jgi:hypothetical protein